MSIHHPPLEGKLVLVVMGERENGRFLLHVLVKKGAFLVVVCSPNAYSMMVEAVRGETLLHKHCFLIPATLTDRQLVIKLIREIAHIFRQIDIFIDYSTPPAKSGSLTSQNSSSILKPSLLFPNVPLATAVLGQMINRI